MFQPSKPPMFGQPGAGAALADVRRLRHSIRTIRQLDPDTSVVVKQLDCTEPGCPPVETVLAVLAQGAAIVRWTLPRPAADIDDAHLRLLFATAPDGDHHL